MGESKSNEKKLTHNVCLNCGTINKIHKDAPIICVNCNMDSLEAINVWEAKQWLLSKLGSVFNTALKEQIKTNKENENEGV